jgi:hypothetical protein
MAVSYGQMRTLDLASFDCYVEYINSECDTLFEQEHAAWTYEDLEAIINHLRLPESLTKPRADLRTSLVAAHPRLQNRTDAQLDNSIDLAVRLFLTINVRSSKLQSVSTASKTAWTSNESFEGFLADRLPERKIGSKRPLTKHFTACNLQRYAGFPFIWTNNLLDHLLLDRDGWVHIYHHVTVLEALRDSSANSWY